MSKPVLGANRGRSPGRAMGTHFQSSAIAMREKLNAVSPSMCLAKWLQVSIHLPTGRTHSCYHPPTHEIPLDGLAENPALLHDTPHKKKQRRKMLDGERPAECEYCWKIEDAPGDHLSDRHYRSAEQWAAPAFDEVLRVGATGDIHPRAVEVNFNHACQLKCSYCSPHLSSTWMEEIKEHGPYPILEGAHNDLGYFQREGMIPRKLSEANPYAEAFWKWWPEIYPGLRVFRMTGGEPLMDINTFRVLDAILEKPNPELDLAITSNFAVREELMEKFLTRIRRVADGRYVRRFQLYLSCDSWGAQAEYQRFGLDFAQFIENADRFLSEVNTASVTFIVTFNALSVTGWDRFLDEILRLRRKHSLYAQRVFFDTPLLRSPAWQSLQVLTPDFQETLARSLARMKNLSASYESIESRFHRVLDFEAARMERNLAWMREPLSPPELHRRRANFYLFFSEHDRRRGTDFAATFPEMRDFWNLCAEAAR